jgi:hypothetical protein
MVMSTKRLSTRIPLIEAMLTKMAIKRELGSRFGMTATNIVENTRMVKKMELSKKSLLTAMFAGECIKMIIETDILHISSKMETYSLANSKMEMLMAIAYTNGLVEKHITGSTLMTKKMDTDSLSMKAIIRTMGNLKMVTDQVKQCGQMLKQEKLRKNFGRMTSL